MVGIWGLGMDNDQRQAARLMQVGLVVLILVLVAFFQSCSELRYAVSGKTGTGEVRKITPVLSSGSSRRSRRFGGASDRKPPVAIDLNYRHPDGETLQFEIRVPSTTLKQGDRVDFEYLNLRKARLAGSGSMFWPGVLALMVVVSGGWCAYAYSLAKKGVLA